MHATLYSALPCLTLITSPVLPVPCADNLICQSSMKAPVHRTRRLWFRLTALCVCIIHEAEATLEVI